MYHVERLQTWAFIYFLTIIVGFVGLLGGCLSHNFVAGFLGVAFIILGYVLYRKNNRELQSLEKKEKGEPDRRNQHIWGKDKPEYD